MPVAHVEMEAVTDCLAQMGYGQVLVYEATAAELVANGLADACDIPDPCVARSINRISGNDYFLAVRMAGDLVQLQISAHLVRQRDAGFVDFMAMTVGRAIVNIAAKP
jgi:hypothetical protein